MIPEVPYQSKGLHDITLKHIANIAPGQRNRAVILEAIHLKDKDKTHYYLRVFSEYGTETVEVPLKLSSPPARYLLRRVRCILKPGTYKFYLQISADKAYPITGVIEANTAEGEIRVLKPNQETISLRDLDPIDKSKLPRGAYSSIISYLSGSISVYGDGGGGAND